MRVQRVDEEDRPPSHGTLDYRRPRLFGVSGRTQVPRSLQEARSGKTREMIGRSIKPFQAKTV
jgi:hypothetical protein